MTTLMHLSIFLTQISVVGLGISLFYENIAMKIQIKINQNLLTKIISLEKRIKDLEKGLWP